MKVRTGWDEADSSSEVRQISDGVETINFPRVNALWSVELSEMSGYQDENGRALKLFCVVRLSGLIANGNI